TDMRIRFVLALLVVVATVAAYGGTVLATSMHGVTSTVLGIAQFNEISAKTLSSSWQARISPKGESDVWMLQNVIVPGGSLRWHSRPGPPARAGRLHLSVATGDTRQSPCRAAARRSHR